MLNGVHPDKAPADAIRRLIDATMDYCILDITYGADKAPELDAAYRARLMGAVNRALRVMLGRVPMDHECADCMPD